MWRYFAPPARLALVAFLLAYALGVEQVDVFHTLQGHLERLPSFDLGMTGMTGMATSVASIFPFASLAEDPETPVRLVDVGGGKGHTTQEIQTTCSGLKGAAVVLQDLPSVLGNKDDERPRFQPRLDITRFINTSTGRDLPMEFLWPRLLISTVNLPRLAGRQLPPDSAKSGAGRAGVRFSSANRRPSYGPASISPST
ncbi:uncharacterized protein RCC_02313 [Aspergillus udagawae]|uniref:Uncharacterized protein RCC_02313 n=1 Tax=Aspergillus udagawae TaxID=91492 RepID=A0ABQ1B3P6_9EURO|nr:uncharacterized protein RCC_02313 [Aspergillus udagawae]